MSWGVVVLMFAGLWIMQIVLTQLQSRHYYQQLREMQQQPSGYLGVGVNKRRFGTGAVVILVTDTEGMVTQCRRMAGVSVFSRFQPWQELTGQSIDRLYERALQATKHPTQTAVRMAIEQIRSAQARQQQQQQLEIS